MAVVDGPERIELRPRTGATKTGLIFIAGGGVAARAYAPLLRPIANAGHPVFVVKLPWRFAPWASHKDTAVARARDLMSANPSVPRWVVSGHSLGAVLACRVARTAGTQTGGLVLIGTTHPRDEDLSSLTIPVTKVYGSNDGVAPPARMFENKALLPAHTKWIAVNGGNHSQFGHYGHQLLDGKATISREAQQAITRAALLDALARR